MIRFSGKDLLNKWGDPAENYIARQSLNVQYVTTSRGLLVKAGSDMEIWQGSNFYGRYLCVK